MNIMEFLKPNNTNAKNLILASAIKASGAVPSDIPGLWVVDGYKELTVGQLISIYGGK